MRELILARGICSRLRARKLIFERGVETSGYREDEREREREGGRERERESSQRAARRDTRAAGNQQ